MPTSTPPVEIRITDLRNPVLSAEQEALLAEAEREPVELSVDAVLATARDAASLSDFGPDDFVARLALWLGEIDENPNRTAFSRRRMYRDCCRLATNRLRVVDLLRRHPEIHDIEIVSPLVIVGMPRTGTTHLLNVIAADERFRTLQLWESLEPVPVPGEEPGPDGIDPRFLRAQDAWQRMRRSNPNGAAMHAMNPEHIHEELELECIDFSSYRMEWSMQMLPRWRDHYLAHDQTPHYEFLRTMLKVLQWQRGPDRWVLKCPQHLEQLGPLMSTFPDATVVLTHRDPVSVIQSAVTMMGNNARLSFKHLDVDTLFEYWADRVERLLSAGVRDLHLVPEPQRVDVMFHELMADQLGVIRSVYERAGLPLSDETRAELERHIAEHPRGKEGRVVYDLRADFGVEPEELRRRFSFYVDRFPVKAEVH